MSCKPAATGSRSGWGSASRCAAALGCLLLGIAAAQAASREPDEDLRYLTPESTTIRHEGDRATFTVIWKGRATGSRDCPDLLGKPQPDNNSSLTVYQSESRDGPWGQIYENPCVRDTGEYKYTTSPFDKTSPPRVYFKVKVCAPGAEGQEAACDARTVKVRNETYEKLQ